MRGADLTAFEEQAKKWPYVRDCFMLNGEVDFLLRCVSPNLSSFQRFLTDDLTSAPNVANVKTQLVVRNTKHATGLPLELIVYEEE